MAAPSRVLRLIPLIRWIITFGQTLATTLQQNANPGADHASRRFRGSDIATVLARIARGLLLARGLDAWLVKRAVAGRDLTPARAALPSLSGTTKPGTPRTPRRPNIIDLPLDHLPTAQEIAAEFRRRPVGAVLVDICRSLGIKPNDLPDELSRALTDAVRQYGGNMVDLIFKEERERRKAGFSYNKWAQDLEQQPDQPALPPPRPALPSANASPPRPAACPTGPPDPDVVAIAA